VDLTIKFCGHASVIVNSLEIALKINVAHAWWVTSGFRQLSAVLDTVGNYCGYSPQYDTIDEFNVDWKAGCGQLNLINWNMEDTLYFKL